jgi:hypothetical protein
MPGAILNRSPIFFFSGSGFRLRAPDCPLGLSSLFFHHALGLERAVPRDATRFLFDLSFGLAGSSFDAIFSRFSHSASFVLAMRT